MGSCIYVTSYTVVHDKSCIMMEILSLGVRESKRGTQALLFQLVSIHMVSYLVQEIQQNHPMIYLHSCVFHRIYIFFSLNLSFLFICKNSLMEISSCNKQVVFIFIFLCITHFSTELILSNSLIKSPNLFCTHICIIYVFYFIYFIFYYFFVNQLI